jgi:hypothetical protein
MFFYEPEDRDTLTMLLTLKLPKLLPEATSAKIEKVFATEGQFLQPGAKICDLRIDLSAISEHDCPPVSFFRIAFRDRAWLRRVSVVDGDIREVGAELALFSTERDETTDFTPVRSARFTAAGIIHQSALWDQI